MRPSLFFTTSLTLSSHFRRHSIVRQVRAASSLHSTTRNDDGTIMITPDDESLHSASIILCHGLGDTAMGWEQPARVRIHVICCNTFHVAKYLRLYAILCSHHMLTS